MEVHSNGQIAETRIAELLGNAASDSRNFPATDLYNEGWMLRLVLDWFQHHRSVEHDLQFLADSNWYSEALLPSPFLPRYRGDKLAESWTHADGVIGHFSIGDNGAGDLSLLPEAKQFIVTEAKMFSKLSSRVTNAGYYNQAARNVACIAEVIRRAGLHPNQLEAIAFLVVAPESRINEGIFSTYMDEGHIQETLQKRVSEYDEADRARWYDEAFEPLMEKIKIRVVPWEELIAVISREDTEEGPALQDFYSKCLKFNQFVARRFG